MQTIGSLFSGIGGIDIGFQQAGFEIAWAIEKDPACCRTYRSNFPEIKLYEGDIQKIDPKELPPVDILVGGFPCQPFSIAGKQLGFADKRGNLFYDIIRFIKVLRPRYVFLENVANLVDHDNGRTFITIHNLLAEQDYYMRYRVMRSSDYGGLAQIRDRTYIVAFREYEDCEKFEFPKPIPCTQKIEDVLQLGTKKHSAYYLDKCSAFYNMTKNIVNKKPCIYRVYHDSIKLIQNNMCPTLTAAMGAQKNQVHLTLDDYGIRKITIQECLDFQGFPKTFKFPHTITLEDAYKQIGNSVSVPVIRRIAEVIKEQTKD